MTKEFITIDYSTRFVPYAESKHYKKPSPFIIRHKEGIRRTAQLYMNPCRDFPPSFYEYERRSYRPNIFDRNRHESREAAFHAVYGGHFYSKKEKESFYEMSDKIYQGDKVVCLTRPQLIKEYENHSRFLRFSASLGRSSYFSQMFIPPYDDHTTKTDTALYCIPYCYNKKFHQTTLPQDQPYNRTYYWIIENEKGKTVKKDADSFNDRNKSIYFGTPFDLKEYERLREFKRNHCKDIKL